MDELQRPALAEAYCDRVFTRRCFSSLPNQLPRGNSMVSSCDDTSPPPPCSSLGCVRPVLPPILDMEGVWPGALALAVWPSRGRKEGQM